MKEMIKGFSSRKNKVELYRDGESVYVLKQYRDEKVCAAELSELQSLHGQIAPEIYGFGDNFIKMEYIDGRLLLDEFIFGSPSKMAAIVKPFAEFLKLYNKLSGHKIILDVNFRNFILKDGKCYGMDFEETRFGMTFEQLGKVAAFAIMYHQSFEKTAAFIDALLAAYGYKREKIKKACIDEVSQLAAVRSINPPVDFINEYFNNSN